MAEEKVLFLKHFFELSAELSKEDLSLVLFLFFLRELFPIVAFS